MHPFSHRLLLFSWGGQEENPQILFDCANRPSLLKLSASCCYRRKSLTTLITRILLYFLTSTTVCNLIFLTQSGYIFYRFSEMLPQWLEIRPKSLIFHNFSFALDLSVFSVDHFTWKMLINQILTRFSNTVICNTLKGKSRGQKKSELYSRKAFYKNWR